MSRFERWSIWLTSAATALTGIGYFIFRYVVSTDDPFAVVNHPLEPIFLKAHVLVSPTLLYAVGLISIRHVWRHFRSGVRRARRSGLATALAVAPMVATGYLIQVLTDAGWIRAMAIAHIALGLVYVVTIVAHRWALGRSSGSFETTVRNNEGIDTGVVGPYNAPSVPSHETREHRERRGGGLARREDDGAALRAERATRSRSHAFGARMPRDS